MTCWGLFSQASVSENNYSYAPLLQYFANKDYQGKIEVLPKIFSSQEYGIALPQGSTIREPINRLLLKRIHEAEWQDLLYRYLGS